MNASNVCSTRLPKNPVGFARRILELHDVHLVAEASAQKLDRIGPGTVGMRRVDADHPRNPVDVPQRHLPDDEAAPVVTDEDGLVDLEMIEEPNEVVGQMFDVVGLDRLGPVGRAIAALVRRDHPDAGLAQRLDLVTPGEGEFRPTVAQHHRRLVADRARLVVAHADSVRLHELERWHLNHPQYSYSAAPLTSAAGGA
ncbi:hypothetical protein ACVWZ3_001547 [Bradyrhizobium sp. i1.3.6]